MASTTGTAAATAARDGGGVYTGVTRAPWSTTPPHPSARGGEDDPAIPAEEAEEDIIVDGGTGKAMEGARGKNEALEGSVESGWLLPLERRGGSFPPSWVDFRFRVVVPFGSSTRPPPPPMTSSSVWV